MARKKKKDDLSMTIVKWIVIGLFAIFIVFFVFQRTMYFFKHSDLFRVKDVVRDPTIQFIESRHVMGLKDKNIFMINLKAVKKKLQSYYPEIEQLSVRRQLPDKILITAKKREPFALVHSGEQDVVVDKSGAVLSFSTSAHSKLPLIEGVRLHQKAILGKSLKYREISVAIDIISLIHQNKNLAPLTVSTIDVTNLSKIKLVLSNQLKVVLDRDHMIKKINKLGIVLTQGNLQLQNVDYVDLRFKEPILGQK